MSKPKSDETFAHEARVQAARELIEMICVLDPVSGEEVPVFEPNPDNPRAYRETAAARRLKSN